MERQILRFAQDDNDSLAVTSGPGKYDRIAFIFYRAIGAAPRSAPRGATAPMDGDVRTSDPESFNALPARSSGLFVAAGIFLAAGVYPRRCCIYIMVADPLVGMALIEANTALVDTEPNGAARRTNAPAHGRAPQQRRRTDERAG